MNRITSSSPITFKRGISLLAAFACLSVFPASAQSYQRVIRVSPAGGDISSLGGWRIAQSASYAASKRALGRPSREVIKKVGSSCGTGWWHRLGVTIDYDDFGYGRCATHGFVQVITIRGKIGRNRWKTDRGLRIGDSVARLHHSYPHAHRTGSSYLLHPHYQEVVGGLFSFLVAHTSHGRVDRFILWIGGAGE